MVVILVLSPVESVNKPLNDEDFAYYRRISRCIAGWQASTLVTLYCLDWLDYFYAGYSSLVLVAVFLIAGKISAKYYTWLDFLFFSVILCRAWLKHVQDSIKGRKGSQWRTGRICTE